MSDALKRENDALRDEVKALREGIEKVRTHCNADAGREGGYGNRYADGCRDMAIEVINLLPEVPK